MLADGLCGSSAGTLKLAELPKIARGRLASEQAGEHAHPDADLLTAFAEQALRGREREQVLVHLAQCQDCREIAMLAGGAAPEAELVPAPVAGSGPDTKKSLWSWAPLRWTAAAATAAVVLSAVWLNHKEAQQDLTSGSDASPAIVQLKPQAPNAPGASETAIDRRKIEPANNVSQSSSSLKAKTERAPSPQAATPAAEASTGEGLLLDKKQGVANSPTNEKENAGFADGRSRFEVDSVQAQRSKQAVGGPVQAAGTMVPRRDVLTAGNSANGVAGAPAAPPVTMTYSRKASADLAPATAVAQNKPVAEEAKVAVQQNSQSKDEQLRNSAEQQVQIAAQTQTAEIRPQLQKSMATPAAILIPWWRVTQSGQLQNSFDSGKTWNTALGERFAKFRAVASLHALVWAGGDDGEIWSSSDGGKTWARAVANVDGHSPKGNVQKIEIANPTTVTIKTDAGETWTTNNGGIDWTVKYE